MTTKLLAFAAELTETNPAGAQLIVDLDNAETAADVISALEIYDVSVEVDSDELVAA